MRRSRSHPRALPANRARAFLLVFAAWLVVLGFLQLRYADRLESLTVPCAAGTATLLRLVGVRAHAEGATVLIGSARMDVIVECLGLGPIAVLAAFIVAFPAGWRRRAQGLVVGALVLQAANLVRLCLSGLALVLVPRAFPVLHDLVWQLGFVALTAGTGYAWARGAR